MHSMPCRVPCSRLCQWRARLCVRIQSEVSSLLGVYLVILFMRRGISLYVSTSHGKCVEDEELSSKAMDLTAAINNLLTQRKGEQECR